MKHHVWCAAGALDSEDVVPDDGGTRVSGERSTTPRQLPAPWASKAWCPATKTAGPFEKDPAVLNGV